MNSFSRIIVIQENGTAINVAREGKRGEDGSNNGGEARAFFVRAFIRSNRKSIELPDNQNRAPTRSRSIFPGRGRIKFENFN